MINTIAIFRTGGIGDVVLSTVSISILKEHYPDARIIWLGRQETNVLIRSVFPGIDTYDISGSRSYFENLSLIKNSAEKIDAIIDLQHSARTLILGRLAAIYFRCSYTSWNKYSLERSLLVIQSKIRGRKFSFDLFRKELPNRYEAMALCTIRALKKAGSKIKFRDDYRPDLSPEKTEKINAAAVCLGAKYAAKALPLETIKQFIEQLLIEKNIAELYLLGSADERSKAAVLSEEFGDRIRISDLTGTTTLPEAAKVLSKCRFALANDSALAHLSEAVGTNVLTFFGPTHQKFGYRPYLKNSRTLSVEIGCRPCNKNGDVNCRYKDHACSSFTGTKIIETTLKEVFND